MTGYYSASLYSVLLLVIAGIAIQEIMGGEYRTAYIALTIGATLMFILCVKGRIL